MKKNNLLFLLFLGSLFWLQLSQSSCTNDTLPEPDTSVNCDSLQVTYDNQVKPIIDASCAFAGCHVAGFPWGNYTTYAGMTPFLNPSLFENEVIVTMDMPDGSLTLTPEELEIMECWVSNNYAEN